MQSAPRSESLKWAARIALLLLVFLALVASRRWQQVTCPQVWAEDGTLISSFLESGWIGVFQPLNGYLVLAPRMITGISLLVSIYYYPIVSTVLACLFAASVGVAVAVSPTRLRGRILCAAAIFLVPSDTEVFGPPLYTLWWAPILLLLVALWDERREALFLRFLYLVIGGLSSPYILVVLPVLYFRALRFRKVRSEVLVAVAATAVAAVQARFIAGGATMGRPPFASFAQYVLPRFCGWFLVGGISENGYLLWPAGIALLAMIVAYFIANRRDGFAWILVYLYLGAVASSVLRADPAALHPFRGGPRYFFFPFFITSWILIQLALTAGRTWITKLAGIAALIGAMNAIPQWTRNHDDLHWGENLVSARLFSDYYIPIQFDGHWFRAWSIAGPGAFWMGLLEKDHLLSSAELDACPTFAFRIVSAEELNADGWDMGNAPNSGRIVSITRPGTQKETVLSLSANRRIRFRSGPASGPQFMEVVGHESMFIRRLPMTKDWVTLEFSNSRLPKEFVIRVVDHGQGVGEWAAIGAQ
jgi:hypothetical protein